MALPLTPAVAAAAAAAVAAAAAAVCAHASYYHIMHYTTVRADDDDDDDDDDGRTARQLQGICVKMAGLRRRIGCRRRLGRVVAKRAGERVAAACLPACVPDPLLLRVCSLCMQATIVIIASPGRARTLPRTLPWTLPWRGWRLLASV